MVVQPSTTAAGSDTREVSMAWIKMSGIAAAPIHPVRKGGIRSLMDPRDGFSTSWNIALINYSPHFPLKSRTGNHINSDVAHPGRSI